MLPLQCLKEIGLLADRNWRSICKPCTRQQVTWVELDEDGKRIHYPCNTSLRGPSHDCWNVVQALYTSAVLCKDIMLHKDLTTSPEGQDKRLIAMQMMLAVRRLSAGDLTQKQPPDS